MNVHYLWFSFDSCAHISHKCFLIKYHTKCAKRSIFKHPYCVSCFPSPQRSDWAVSYSAGLYLLNETSGQRIFTKKGVIVEGRRCSLLPPTYLPWTEPSAQYTSVISGKDQATDYRDNILFETATKHLQTICYTHICCFCLSLLVYFSVFQCIWNGSTSNCPKTFYFYIPLQKGEILRHLKWMFNTDFNDGIPIHPFQTIIR